MAEDNKVWILDIEDSDESRTYYYVPNEWYDWISQTCPLTELEASIPASLKQSYLAEFGEEISGYDFAWGVKTFQIIAADQYYIGSSMKSVWQWFEQNGYNLKDLYELEGTFY